MSDTRSSPATMRGWAIRACGEAMVLMDDLPGAVSVQRPGVDIMSDYIVHGDHARLAEVVPFDEAQRALDLVLARHVRGKVVSRIT